MNQWRLKSARKCRKNPYFSSLKRTTFLNQFFLMYRCTSKPSDSKSISVFMHKHYWFNSSKGAISDRKGVHPCRVDDYEKSLDKIVFEHLSDFVFRRTVDVFSIPDVFLLYGNLGFTLFTLLSFLE